MTLWQDIRYGIRVLGQSPGFALTAIVTIGLGIGATTSVFSVCDAMLWKPVPLPHLETLAMVLEQVPEDSKAWNTVTPADFEDIGRDNSSFASLASWTFGAANLVGSGGEPERVNQVLTTANFFDVLGVPAAIGRAFQPGEDQSGRERVAVLSDRLWRRRFGADPAIVGQTILLDSQGFMVVGIMPGSFDFPVANDIWTPLAMDSAARGSRANHSLLGIGRLKPRIAPRQAEADIERTGTRLQQAFPPTNKSRHFMVWRSIDFMIDGYTRQYLTMLMGSVIFVLLIACANVANLQFARATGRLREVAVRTALGASRWRVITQLLTESVILSMSGAALGLLLAKWGINMMSAGMPPEVAQYILGWRDMQLDTRTLIFTLAAAVSSGILAGLAPAWQCSRPNLTDSLKEGGRGGTAGRARNRLRNMLVAAEVGLAVVLLVGAGLMVRGFRAQLRSGEALEPRTLLTMQIGLTASKYKEQHRVTEFYQQVLARTAALPGVRSATAVTAIPYTDHSSGRMFVIEGRPVEPGKQPNAMYQVASPEYFSTLHVRLVSGRLLTAGDGPDAPQVVAISELLARRWFPSESPIGKHLKLGLPDSNNPWLTIVGVVGDVTHNPYDRQPRPTIYRPYHQAPSNAMDIGVRTMGDPLRMAPAVLAAIRSVDPEQPVTQVMTLERAIHDRAIGLNYMAALMGVFGALAMVLSAVGVYGVMAHLVSEETHEIGIRMALGASRASVLGMILRRGMGTTVVGLAVGIAMAFGLARLLSSLIFGVTAADPATFIGIPVALITTAAMAIVIPARRATKVDPVVALRYE
jgi:putative ABC transport system permease protein